MFAWIPMKTYYSDKFMNLGNFCFTGTQIGQMRWLSGRSPKYWSNVRSGLFNAKSGSSPYLYGIGPTVKWSSSDNLIRQKNVSLFRIGKGELSAKPSNNEYIILIVNDSINPIEYLWKRGYKILCRDSRANFPWWLSSVFFRIWWKFEAGGLINLCE